MIGTEHLLIGLIREEEGIAAQVLRSFGITLEPVKERVRQRIRPSPATTPTATLPFTPQVQKVLELALREAMELKSDYVGPEHLLLGLLREGDGAVQVLTELGADPHRVRQRVIELVTTSASLDANGRQSSDNRPTDESGPASDNAGVSRARKRRVAELLKDLVRRNDVAGLG